MFTTETALNCIKISVFFRAPLISLSHLYAFYSHIREYLLVYSPLPLKTNARKNLSPIPTEWAAGCYGGIDSVMTGT